ncbi:Ketopantoate reductase PanE/ApbA family protein [Trichomonas vaginalis G3]|uniref:2-dehydropantoate 2-reductase n=1 Tax=Trichomonas vaginalis (strain ATCC PRA-98 / G3) TaxID=412133 RepID=A2H0N5_TRIV3|nr:2-dehydropantoate 2-reductase family [Trichomonas vaginalis G3]EAX77032.1 Ketopantoate reductase PanE/ApbA family protein [Trichomonas vaginalis G3]KAI5518291.1 2-dehydropantoate 2-reductase family [Trichomonas vaginalis G3]|eukprot:XP_001289962.1 Ketopantoate reductase PanE/ApbA family protein [Trichomonas vaginalis G3]
MSEEHATLKVAIAGAGAMGTLFGTTLLEGGNDVVFFDAWPKLLEEMKKTPVAHRILEDGKEKDYDVKVFPFEEAPEEEKDLIIITVKSSDTDATLQKIKARKMIGKNTVILTLQGGFDNADVIAKYHENKDLILFGKTACSSSGCPPRMMTIQKFKIANTTIWPLGCAKDATPVERVQEVVKAVNASGLPFELTNLAIPDRWKMLLYYPANIAVSAVVNLDFSTCWNCEPLQKVLEKLGEECAQIAELEGVDTKFFNKEIAVEAVKKLALEECPKHQGSMNQDVFNQRKTEIEATAGVLLKLAEKHKVELPYTHTIYALIRAKESNYGNECQKPAAK